MIVLPMPGCARFGRIGLPPEVVVGAVEVHRFPDGEARVRLAGAVDGEEVILVAALDRPDEKILPVLFVAATARELGAASVGLVAPYLPYLRQDRRFHPGEGVSARQFAALLSRPVDWLVTVDPHLHRIHRLSELFDIPAEAVHAAPLLAEWIREHVEAPLILGPDAESLQWVESIARLVDAPHAVCRKRRTGDRRVEITLPDLAAHAGRRPVLVDDVIASAGTMAAAVRALRSAGWPAPTCLAVHAVFADGAREALRDAGPAAVATCNTIAHPSNRMNVERLLAEAVGRRLRPSPAGTITIR
jgi:ribose-phosphate pyrophosphokinase